MAAKNPPAPPEKQTKVSQSDIPSTPLDAALRIAHALNDQFAGKGAAPHDIAMALDVSPTSSSWRVLTGAAVAYGLTQGAYNATTITLTDLGRRIVAPTEEGADQKALLEAMLKPRILRDFFTKYDRAKFPREDIAKNVLVSLGVPKDRAERVLQILTENGKRTGVIRETKTGPFVALASASMAPAGNIAGDAEQDTPLEELSANGAIPELASGVSALVPPSNPPAPAEAAQPKQIFVAHGKNHKPLEELKKILDQFKIPYKVAVEEPNVGRPISKKVAQLMRECNAGIFIFTGDEKFINAEGVEVWRPSENVVYELGAASVLWENKIVILKQKDVNFPSDFSDLGYIPFAENNLSAHALDLLKELIGLEFIKVQAA